jgi:DNA-binding transcriptional LysR family regulator
MDLSDLLIFKTVAEEGGILRAAGKLHRVPSNVTTRIRQLEASLGTPLFIRERQRLVISPGGRMLLGYAERLLRLADEARHSLVQPGPSGVLRLGALESTSASRLPAVLSRFHKTYPDVRVELQTGTNDALTAGVKERRLDAAFVVERPSDSMLESMTVFAEKLVLIASRDHPPIVRPLDVADDSIIAFPAGCAYRRVLERWLGGQGTATMRVLELHSYHAMVACVAAGTGVALLPESVLQTVRAAAVTRHRLPKVFERASTPLIWRASEASPAVAALCNQLERAIGGQHRAN